MTQNEATILKNAILDATEAYVETKLNMSNFVKTQIGVIHSYEKRNNKYYHTVKCDNGRVTYNNVLSIGNIPFPIDSTVFLISPNAQFSNQFILGRLGDTPYSVGVTSINIGNGTFVVDTSGNMYSASAEVNGSFYGHVESNSGIINGISYNDNTFFGSPTIKDSTTGNTINIRTNGTKPTITRTFTQDDVIHEDEILWEYDLGNKQNFIDQSSTPPTASSGENGDLRFQSGTNGFKRLYRKENNAWVRVNFIDSGTTDPTDGVDGDIYFQNDGTKIIKIWQKINGNWLFFEGGSANPPTVTIGNAMLQGNVLEVNNDTPTIENAIQGVSQMSPRITISNY